MPTVGAKFDTAFRIGLVKYTLFRRPLRTLVSTNVTLAQTNVSSAFVKVEEGDENVLPISDTASTTKMALMSTEKISSVKRVRYLTKFDAEKSEHSNRIPAVHSPVQLYKGRKGSPVDSASCTSVATNASTGPVDPMIVSGCAAKSA
jgi:hypothetical protein